MHTWLAHLAAAALQRCSAAATANTAATTPASHTCNIIPQPLCTGALPPPLLLHQSVQSLLLQQLLLLLHGLSSCCRRLLHCLDIAVAAAASPRLLLLLLLPHSLLSMCVTLSTVYSMAPLAGAARMRQGLKPL